MKTIRKITQKYQFQEEISLSSTDLSLAIKEFIERRITKFQTGWCISVDSLPEAKVVISKWIGFTCHKCNSVMISKVCKLRNCQNFICETNSKIGKCCVCLIEGKEAK